MGDGLSTGLGIRDTLQTDSGAQSWQNNCDIPLEVDKMYTAEALNSETGKKCLVDLKAYSIACFALHDL